MISFMYYLLIVIPIHKISLSNWTIVLYKNNKDVIANIMFYCTHSKSFSGCYDDAMLMNIILGSYIKENCQTIVSTHTIDSFI